MPKEQETNMKIADLKSYNGLHRIAKADEEKVWAEVDRILEETPDMTELQKRELKYKRDKVQSFKKKFSKRVSERVKNPSTIQVHRLYWENLPELMKIVGINYRRLLEVVATDEDGNSYPIKWPNEELELLCYICDKILDADARRALLDLVKSSAPMWIRELVESDRAPLNKLFDYTKIVEELRGETRLIAKQAGLEKEYIAKTAKNKETILAHSQIPLLADHFDVSVHYLLGLDENTTVLAENGTTEMIIDYYRLLEQNQRNALLTALEMHTGFGGENA